MFIFKATFVLIGDLLYIFALQTKDFGRVGIAGVKIVTKNVKTKVKGSKVSISYDYLFCKSVPVGLHCSKCLQ